MRLGDVIELGNSDWIRIEDSKEYVIAGVQSYGKGVVNRRTERGRNLNMKEYQLIAKDCLMWCKVDTKNGAFGITKDEHIGSLASTNMCLAKVKVNKIYPEFLEKLFRFSFFHENITHLSSGSTNRKYLTPKQLCEIIEIPNLTLTEQKRYLQFARKLEENGLLQEQSHQLDLIKKLRQQILSDAIQGKLVPQNNKKSKNWSCYKLGEILKLEYGKALPNNKRKSDGKYPVYGANGLKGRSDDFYFDKRTIIVGRKGSAGEINLTEEKFWPLDVTYFVTFDEKKYNLLFLFHLLNFLNLPKLAKGVKPGINRNEVYDLAVIIPPLSEQKRIVAKIDELMTLCDELERSVRNNREYTELLYQTALRGALQGKENVEN